MWKVARRPRWIGALVLTLALCAAFVLLSQWQIGRAVAEATVIERDTETVVPLTTLAEPQSPVHTEASGHRVSVDGSFVSGDFGVLSGRINGGVTGYWVTGQLLASNGTSLATAVGWAETQDDAEAAAGILNSETAEQQRLIGRYLPSEPAQDEDFENGERRSMAVATFINVWSSAPDTVYGGFLVLAEPLAGLDVIDSPVPVQEVVLNWLNIFYAIEWVVFAGLAIYLWYRLVKDAWEREEEEKAQVN
jgi:surfeit locus 1 family protein